MGIPERGRIPKGHTAGGEQDKPGTVWDIGHVTGNGVQSVTFMLLWGLGDSLPESSAGLNVTNT